MIPLIIRADDLGYSEAVNYGIAKTVQEGLVGSVGVMPNMPAAVHGLKLLEGTGVCLGQHTNLCVGKPCADPAQIPSLLDENGNFRSSRDYRTAWKEGREFTVLDEMVVEIEAQYQRFQTLTGQKPHYFEGHAIMSKHLFQGLEIVAQRHNLPLQTVNFQVGTGMFRDKPLHTLPMGSMNPDYDPLQCLRDGITTAPEGIPCLFVSHPGYLDDFILHNSTLTVNRTKEVVMLCDPTVRDWLNQQDVELITYDDI